MAIDKPSKILNHYLNTVANISKSIHSNDDMYKKSSNGWDDYSSVGRSTIELLDSVVEKYQVKTDDILDFGCGHGRVARHLRLAFPHSRLSFSDIDDSGWQFCASEFNGMGFPSAPGFSELKIPGKYDLIWLGSVFTHLDWDRSVQLLTQLASSLKPQGVVVATVRGKACYETMVNNPDRFNIGGYYDQLLNEYEKSGFGYMDYKDFKDWGQHLINPANLSKLAKDSNSQLLEVVEQGWANIHDVAVFGASE
jgi:SAM-dependent methyltransferase